jgi:hypothetical protein
MCLNINPSLESKEKEPSSSVSSFVCGMYPKIAHEIAREISPYDAAEKLP